VYNMCRCHCTLIIYALGIWLPLLNTFIDSFPASSANIAISYTLPETRVFDLHFCAENNHVYYASLVNYDHVTKMTATRLNHSENGKPQHGRKVLKYCNASLGYVQCIRSYGQNRISERHSRSF